MAIVRHRKSAIPGKIPSYSGMTFGEIFVNYASGTGKSFLATLKNDKKSVAQFMEKSYNDSVYANKQSFENLQSNAVTGIVLSDKVTEMGKKNGVVTIPIPQGAQGLAGPQGYQGAQGATGTGGDRGTQGGTGLQGFKGTQGPIGTDGDRGTQGSAGLQGYQGTQGVVGATGEIANLTTGTTVAYLIGKRDAPSIGWTGTFLMNQAVYMSGGLLYAASDETLKDFHGDIDLDFEKLKSIRKQYFTWKEGDVTDMQIGTSAQDLQKVYPEIVSAGDDGKLAVSYERLSIIALAAIDKLHDRIKILEEKLRDKE